MALVCGPAIVAQGTPDVPAKVREVETVAAQGPFAPNWDSLARYQVPDWYQDAKFGIFIHWGVYSVPAFGNEWYPRNMYKRDEKAFAHHVATYGPQSRFGYKDFIPRFTAEHFDAARWAALFKAAGARYVVPVAEHHDGFAMYDSSFTPWSAAKMGPRRDVIGELAKAVRAEGLVFGVSSHRVEHWWFFDEGKTFDSDVRDPKNAGLLRSRRESKTSEDQKTPPDRAFLDDWLARCAELVDKYQPQLVWFDWWIAQPAVQPYLQQFAAFYYNRGAAWQQGRRHQLQEARRRVVPRHGRRARHRARAAGRHPSAVLADRHVGVEELVGLHREARTTRRWTPSSTTSSTSSARTARCCSTSGRSPTAPSPSRKSGCCARSGSGWR